MRTTQEMREPADYNRVRRTKFNENIPIGSARDADGYKVVQRENGDWSWAEGKTAIAPILTNEVREKIDACCKRRGIKGAFYLREPITIDGVTFA